MLFPQALIPGLREIGHFPLNTWGPVYPRHGFIEQTHATKAAAVCAQRAGDVVTRSLQPHVYTPTSATRVPNLGMKVFYPGGLEETKCNTGWFQMHSPVPLPLCETFGQNDTLLPTSWGDYRTDERGLCLDPVAPLQVLQAQGDLHRQHRDPLAGLLVEFFAVRETIP